jgi:hypothetical protein
VAVLIGAQVHAQRIWHVKGDAAGANNGTNWHDAFTDLHDALGAAKSGDEVWIARGTYTPDRGTKDRTMSFHMVSGVGLYGGFAGWETGRDDRDWKNNETILSGDLNGDDGPQDCAEHSNCCIPRYGSPGCDDPECEALICALDPDCCDPIRPFYAWSEYCAIPASLYCCHLGNWNACENSEIVVIGTNLESATSLNDITVGGAHCKDVRKLCAGIYLSSSTVTFRSCRIIGNITGMLIDNSSFTLEDCNLSENAWHSIFNGSRTTLRGCEFRNNGFGANTGRTTASECVFQKTRMFPALHTGGGPPSDLADCAFIENHFGMRSSNETVTIDNCRFVRNGGLFGLRLDGSLATVNKCEFREHHGVGGATLGGSFASVTVNNSVFVENECSGGGAGCAIRLFDSSLRLNHCTIADNSHGVSMRDGAVAVENSILWGNVHPFISVQSSQIGWNKESTGSVNRSIVQGWNGTLAGVGTFDADPLFVPGPDGDYYLSHGGAGLGAASPAVDAGDDATADPQVYARTTRTDEALDAAPVDLGFHFPVTGRKRVAGDADRDGRVDLRDVAAYQNCFDGPAAQRPAPSCRIFDFNLDDDISLPDLPKLLTALQP